MGVSAVGGESVSRAVDYAREAMRTRKTRQREKIRATVREDMIERKQRMQALRQERAERAFRALGRARAQSR